MGNETSFHRGKGSTGHGGEGGGRRQKAEGRRQKAKGRRQKAEGKAKGRRTSVSSSYSMGERVSTPLPERHEVESRIGVPPVYSSHAAIIFALPNRPLARRTQSSP